MKKINIKEGDNLIYKDKDGTMIYSGVIRKITLNDKYNLNIVVTGHIEDFKGQMEKYINYKNNIRV